MELLHIAGCGKERKPIQICCRFARYLGRLSNLVSELKKIEERGQVVLRYCDEEGNIASQANPNGLSLIHI